MAQLVSDLSKVTIQEEDSGEGWGAEAHSQSRGTPVCPTSAPTT